MKLFKKKKYFQCRDNSFYTEFTKKEIADMIDPFDFNTVRPFLKKMDYGAWETEYNRYVDFAIHSCLVYSIPSGVILSTEVL